MSAGTSPRVRGTIVKTPDAAPGLLFLNEQQKPFTLEGVWRSPVAPAPNMTVDVELDAVGAVAGLIVVDQQQIAREKLNQFGGVAQAQGKQAAKIAQQGVGALAARMGVVALAAIVLLWICWFFIPGYKIDMGMLGSQSFTFWQYLGVDFSNPSFIAGVSNHGFFGMIGILAILAPFAAPFMKDPRAKFLNALPLAYIVVAMISLHFSLSRAAGQMGPEISSAISLQIGVYIMILAALVLAALALKSPATS